MGLTRVLDQPPNRNMLGIALMAGGFFSYAVSDAAAKWLTETLPPMQVVWLRQLGLLAVALVLIARNGPGLLRSGRPMLQVARGLVGAVSSAAFILAIAHVPLADAVAVTFIAPFLVTGFGALLLGEPVGIRRWSAVAVGFIGMLIVLRPGSGVFQPAMLLVVLAASMFATRQILSRVLGPVDSTLTTICYTSIASTALLTLPMLAVWQWPGTITELLLILALAGAAGLGEVLVIRALELAQAVVLAPMHYSMILWSTAFGWLVFSQLPDSWTLIGAAIIMASGIYTVHRERLAARSG